LYTTVILYAIHDVTLLLGILALPLLWSQTAQARRSPPDARAPELFGFLPWDAVHADDFSTTLTTLVECLGIERLGGRECLFKTTASKSVALSESRAPWNWTLGSSESYYCSHRLHLLLATSLSCSGPFACLKLIQYLKHLHCTIVVSLRVVPGYRSL